MEDNKDLIVKVSGGDYFAFARFYDIYYPKVFKIARYFSGSDNTCKEIVSDVFYGLWANRSNLDKVINFDGYLYAAIRNQLIKHKKKQKLFSYDLLEDIPVDYCVEVNSPETLLITDEARRIIQDAINELPPKCKTVFLLIREEGLKYKEVAEMLSISERTVQAHMIAAVKKIVCEISKSFPNIDATKAFMLFMLFHKKKLILH